MKSIVSKMVQASLISCAVISFAHAEEENVSKAEVKKQVQICAKKKQGDWVTYANKGVTYNGACEPNENGKLQFSFPSPQGGASSASASAQPSLSAPPQPPLENRPAIEAPPQSGTTGAPSAPPAGLAPSEPNPDQQALPDMPSTH